MFSLCVLIVYIKLLFCQTLMQQNKKKNEKVFPLGTSLEIGAPAPLWRISSRDRVGQCKLMGAILTVSDSVFIRGRLSINCQIACQTLQCLHWFACNQLIWNLLNWQRSINNLHLMFKLIAIFFMYDCL